MQIKNFVDFIEYKIDCLKSFEYSFISGLIMFCKIWKIIYI